MQGSLFLFWTAVAAGIYQCSRGPTPARGRRRYRFPIDSAAGESGHTTGGAAV